MKEHPSQPCEPAIKEVTRLSKATLNNLRGKVSSVCSIINFTTASLRAGQTEFVMGLKDGNVDPLAVRGPVTVGRVAPRCQ